MADDSVGTPANPGSSDVGTPASDAAESTTEASGNNFGVTASDAQDAAEVLNDPNASKAAKVEAKKTLKSIKIKYNGKEYDEQLPFEIPDDPEAIKYMQKQLQMGKLANTKAQEASSYQKMVDEFLTDLRKNPRGVLSDPRFGVDLKKMAAEMIEEEIENSKKSPDQLAKEAIEKELKALKEEREREKEDMTKREFERLQEQEYERYENQITRTIETSGLPKSPYIVKKIADYMLMGLNAGIDITSEDVLPLVREEMASDLKEMMNSMSESDLENFIGKETINKLRKRNLAKAKEAMKGSTATAAPAKAKDTGTTSAPKSEKTKSKQSMKDYFGF